MIKNVALGLTEIGFGLAGITAGAKVAGDNLGLPESIMYRAAGGFLGLKLGEKCLGINITGVIRQYCFTAFLSAAAYSAFYGNLGQRCTAISTEFLCSYFSYSKHLIAVAAGVSLIYSIYSTITYPMVFQRFVDAKEIRILRNIFRLECEVIDKNKAIIGRFPLANEGESIRKQIEYINKCEPVLGANGSVQFTRPFYREKLTHPITGIEIDDTCSLLQTDRNLVWQLHCTGRSKKIYSHQIPLPCFFLENGIDLYVWPQKPQVYKKHIQQFQNRALEGSLTKEMCMYLLRCYEISRVDKIFPYHVKNGQMKSGYNVQELSYKKLIETKLNEPVNYFIWLKPIIGKSRIDSSVKIFPEFYNITLICVAGWSSKGSNHAEMIIEGIKDRKYFMKMAHLRLPDPNNPKENPNGIVELKDYTNTELKYYGRSVVHSVAFEKAEKMITSIENDVKNPPKLNWLGSSSILAKKGEESCFTYVRGKFKMIDVDIGKSLVDFLASITVNYTPYDRHWNQYTGSYKNY